MSVKHKSYHDVTAPSYQGKASPSSRRQLEVVRQAHAKGKMCSEDFIWAAMQCYAVDNQSKK